MTRSIRGSRRAAVLLAGSAAALLLTSGCGAGQIAETAGKRPTVPGVNLELRTPDGGSYKIRNLVVSYPGVQGYQVGDDAPLEVAIFNDTTRPVTVTVTSIGARSVQLSGAGGETPGAAAPPTASAAPSPGATSATRPGPAATGGALPGPTATGAAQPRPGQPAGQPARIKIPALGFVVFDQRTPEQLVLIGLKQPLKSGQSVNLVFDFGGNQKITTEAPVMVPLTPAPVAPPVVEGNGGHE